SHNRHVTLFLLLPQPPPTSRLFPYTTLFRSLRMSPYFRPIDAARSRPRRRSPAGLSTVKRPPPSNTRTALDIPPINWSPGGAVRSEEHTSELRSRSDLVCRLLLEKKKQHERD